jgi:O-antigen/teichoic acid export membrane protein
LKKKILIAGMRIVGIAGQVGVVKLCTHYLLPAQLGRYFFYQALSYFLNALLFVPIDYFQQAEVFKLKTSGHSLGGLLAMNRRVFSIVGLISACIAALLLLLHAPVLAVFCATLMFSIAFYISSAVKSFLNNQNDQIVAVSMIAVEPVVRMGIFLAIARIGLMGALSPLIAMTISMLLVVLVVIPRVSKHFARFHGSEKHVETKALVRFASPISCSAILNWLQTQGYSLVLVPLGYAETIGLFSTIYNIGNNGMNAASAVYQQIYLPNVYQTSGKYVKPYIKGAIVASAFVLFVALALRVQIVGLITTAKFLPYAWVIGYGVLVEAGNLIISVLIVKLSIDGNTLPQIKANIYAVIAVPLLFAGLYFTHRLNVFTLGIPLVAAQLIVITILCVQSGSGPRKSSAPVLEPAPSLL